MPITLAMCLSLALTVPIAAQQGKPTVAQFLSPSSPLELTRARNTDRIAWVAYERGMRNVYTAAGAAFPKTAAPPPGVFRETFERLLADGYDDVVYVGVSSKLSATVASAKVARDGIPTDLQAHVHIIDSATASMGITLLAQMAVDLAAAGKSPAEIISELERRRDDVKLYVMLETLEYLKRGGRISPARAAIGNVLSVKPIITVEDGLVETADRPRTRGKARSRLLELLSEHRLDQVWLLHGEADGVDEFAADLVEATGIARDKMSTHLIGASVGPHVGPGAYGAVVLLSRG